MNIDELGHRGVDKTISSCPVWEWGGYGGRGEGEIEHTDLACFGVCTTSV